MKTLSGQTFNPKQNKANVVMTIAPDCPLSQQYCKNFSALANKFERDGIVFWGVVPGNYYSQVELNHFVDSFQFNFPLVLDPEFEFLKAIRAKVTPEFFLLDDNLKILYRGKMDDWAIAFAQKKVQPHYFYLENALQDFVNHQPIQTPETEAVGCVIEY